MTLLLVLFLCLSSYVNAAPKTPTPQPVIWDINPKLGSTQGGVVLTIDGYNFGTVARAIQIWLTPQTGTSRGYLCPLTADVPTDTRVYCTLPPGDGLPLFNLSVGNLIMKQLPRWPDDMYFWVWNADSATGPNCIATPNNNQKEKDHTWGDNFFCSADNKASLLLDYSQSGPITGKKCLKFGDAREKGWGPPYTDATYDGNPQSVNSYICVPLLVPFTMQMINDGATSGLACVSVRESSDPTWNLGLSFICAPIGTPYNGGQYQLYQYEIPTITSITPNNGPTVGQITLQIRGRGFGLVRGAVLIGGNNCLISAGDFYNHTYLTCLLPVGEGAANTVQITVTTQVSLTASSPTFRYDAPVVTSISPTTGTTYGQFTLTINGYNFGVSSGGATVGGVYCAVQSWADVVVTCLMPSGMGLNNAVVLTTIPPVQTSNTNVKFNYANPTISSINPVNYPTTGGTQLTVNGQSFGGDGSVYVGGIYCVKSSHTHTQAICSLPAGAGNVVAIQVYSSVGALTNVVPYPFHYDAPSVTLLTPVSATSATGVYLTLTGASFGTVSNGAVTVNGVLCASLAAQFTAGRILCSLPDAVGYRVPVVVQTADQYSNINYFTYTPTVTTITSGTGTFPTSGAVSLTITGTSFASSIPLTSVKLGGVVCAVTASTASTINCGLPVGQGTGVNVNVTINGINAPSPDFAYNAPTLTGVSPSNGATAGGFPIVLTGTNFGTLATVTIGLVPCDVTAQSHVSITCTVRAGSGQSNPVVVTVSGQTSAQPVGFNYNPPTLTKLTPVNGAIDGNITITLIGSDFGSASGLVSVGSNVVSSTYVNSTYATFVLPVGTSGVANVLLRVAGQSSNSITFTYDGPRITAATPLTANTDATGVILALTGTSFGSGAIVKIGTYQCPLYALGLQNTVRYDCSVPPGQGASLAIIMSVGSLDSPYSFAFSYNPPTITQPINPLVGPTSGLNLITITGTSFGLSGSVQVGSQACNTLAVGALWSHTQIICAVTPGQGTGFLVVVTTAGLNNLVTNAATPRVYSYAAPTITSITPVPGPTWGHSSARIQGTNFGLLANVTIGGLLCPIGAIAQSHVQFECIQPVGQGLNQPVVMMVSAQSNPAYTFSFRAPTITSFTPVTGTTNGLYTVVITGKDFGLGTAHTLTFGGQTVTATLTPGSNHTQLTFVAPAGTGTNKGLVLTVAGQTVTFTSTLFNYAAPTLTKVSGCPSDSATSAVDCPIGGGIGLTLTGTNFGNVNAQSVANVTVASLPCPITSIDHAQIVCTLPGLPAGGYSLLVVVRIDGQSSSLAAVSYTGPSLVNGSLVQIAPVPLPAWVSAPGKLEINSTDVIVRVRIGGLSFGNDTSLLTIRYGLPGTAFLAKPFVCTVVAGTLTSGPAFASSVQCDLQVGTGKALVFQIKVNLQLSIEGVDTLSYPAPRLHAASIRLIDVDNTKSTAVTGYNTEGDIVFFDVDNVGGSESIGYLDVRYGLVGQNAKPQVCTGAVSFVHLGQVTIQCTTSPGTGSGYVFQVIANGQESDSDGTDTYSYVTPPSVSAVEGCTPSGNATIDCPTAGGTIITIHGDNFGQTGLAVRIGTQACLRPVYKTTNLLTCELPEGTGSPAAVVVVVGQRFSRSVSYLSYSAALVSTIKGCTDSGVSTLDCARVGGTTVTLTGTNFGPASPPAIVVIGSQYCASVTHNPTTPHISLTCVLPQGTELLQAVLIRQGQGVLSASSVKVSYLPCAKGFFAAIGVTACASCTPGYYTDIIGQATCKACESGKAASVANSTSCVTCIAGTSSEKIGNVGPAACTPCTYGKYGNGDNARVCTDCAQGSYNNATGQASCLPCPVGTYSVGAALTYCELCTPGSYQDRTGSLECTKCPLGTASFLYGATVCAECQPGNYTKGTLGGYTTCDLCDAGTYTDVSRQLKCLSCPAGSYTPTAGLSACALCAPGSAQGSAGLTYCPVCPNRQYTSKPGALTCLTCAQGTVNALSNQTTCTQCDPGTYHTDAIVADVCQPCAQGTFTAVYASVVCQPCAAGKYADSTNALACTPCPAGSYQPIGGQSTCILCQNGTALGDTGQLTCPVCDAGQYSDRPGLLACKLCTAGTYAPTTSATVCLVCGAGTYSSTDGLSDCTPCDAGFYVGEPGASECTRCALGSYAPSLLTGALVGATVCNNCSRGTFAGSTGLYKCSDCTIGRFAADQAASVCTDCPEGQFNPDSGKSVCIDCQIGQYTSKGAQGSCASCPSGTYSDVLGKTQCMGCPAGSFTPAPGIGQLGATVCQVCAVGTFSTGGAALCTPCPPRTYAGAANTTSCSLCPAGRYAATSGHVDCMPAPIGQFVPGEGSDTSYNCSVGQFSAVNGSSFCTDCEAGSHQVNAGQSSCDECEPGQFLASPGQAQCSICEDGTISFRFSSALCQTCPPGRSSTFQLGVSVGAGPTECAECALGKNAPIAGLSLCRSCGQGTYTERTASENCTSCAAGYYNDKTEQANCTQCPRGKVSDGCTTSASGGTTSGCIECVNCGVGTYAARLAMLTCEVCPMGTYQNVTASSSCANCPLGYFGGATGLKQCSPCPFGFYAGVPGLSICPSCEAGRYQANSKESACNYCAAGRFSVAGATVCSDCAAGTYAPTTGSQECRACPDGTYIGGTGSSVCADCDIGYYSNNAKGKTACSQCGAGLIAPYTGTAVCAECDVNAVSNAKHSQCECNPGFASKLVLGLNNTYVCVVCPAGAVCTAPNQVWTSLITEEGWWSVNQTFYRCLKKTDCTGGLLSSCAAHRTGPLCAEVEDGYIEGVGGTITACGTGGNPKITFGFASAAIVIAVLILMITMLRSGRYLMVISERDERLKAKVAAGTYVEGEEEEDEHELGLQANRFGSEITIHGPPPPKPDFSFKLKIALGFAQIISNLEVGLEIQWPSAFKSFMSALTPANIDFIQVSAVGCVVKTKFYEKFFLIILMPPAAIIALVVFFFIPGYIWYHSDSTSRKTIRKQFWRLVFFVLFLVYPYVSSTSLRMFVCKEVEGVDYLLADFSLHCYSDEWYSWARIAAIMSVVYPLGIPGFFLVMMLRYRKRLDEVGVRAELGFIYDAYSRDLWWWEMLDMLHKLVITSLLAFIPFEWQLNSAMVIVCCYGATLYALKPYVRKSDDRLHLVSLTEIIMLLMSGNVFNKSIEPDETMEIVLSIVLITLVILFFLFFLLQAIQAFLKLLKEFRDRRKAKREADAAGVPEEDTIGEDAPLTPGTKLRRQSSATGKTMQSQAEWVAEYQAGTDVTQAVDRTQLHRRKPTATGAAATSASSPTGSASPPSSPGQRAASASVSTARNPMWAGHAAGADGVAVPSVSASVAV